MNKKFLFVVFVVLAAGFGYYGYLGGFNKPETSIKTSRQLFVAGQYYEGPADSREFGDLFQKAGQLQEAKTLTGSLANIYYNNPAEQGDSIKAFIGILVADPGVALPAGYAVRTWDANNKVVQVITRAHFLLAPDKLYPALFEYLKINNLKTQPLYLEQFPEKNYAILEAVLAE